MRVLGMIPARGGSRRLPGKNLALLAGRPLIAHTCAAARSSGVLTRVYVNTDSAAIAAAAAAAGVECPALRPAHLATAEATTRAATLWLLDELARQGERFDVLAILQPTSPLRNAADIRAALKLFVAQTPCSVVSVCAVAPRSWLGTVDAAGRWQRAAGDEPVYRLNGAIYIHRVEEYCATPTPAVTVAYPMPAVRSVDIDTAEELEYARWLLERPLAVERDVHVG